MSLEHPAMRIRFRCEPRHFQTRNSRVAIEADNPRRRRNSAQGWKNSETSGSRASVRPLGGNTRARTRGVPSAPDRPSERARSHEKENGGWQRGGPRHATVAHVLDGGSTGLRGSRGSYVPFCINRETPRRRGTSGRFWNGSNPPAPRDHEGMKVPEVPKALDISPSFSFFSFLPARASAHRIAENVEEFRSAVLLRSPCRRVRK